MKTSPEAVKAQAERMRQARLNAPPRTSAEAYAQMDRMEAARLAFGATSSPSRSGRKANAKAAAVIPAP